MADRRTSVSATADGVATESVGILSKPARVVSVANGGSSLWRMTRAYPADIFLQRHIAHKCSRFSTRIGCGRFAEELPYDSPGVVC